MLKKFFSQFHSDCLILLVGLSEVGIHVTPPRPFLQELGLIVLRIQPNERDIHRLPHSESNCDAVRKAPVTQS